MMFLLANWYVYIVFKYICLLISFVKPETTFSMTTQGFFASPIELFVCSVLSVQCSNFYQKCYIDQNTHSLFSFCQFLQIKCFKFSIKLKCFLFVIQFLTGNFVINLTCAVSLQKFWEFHLWKQSQMKTFTTKEFSINLCFASVAKCLQLNMMYSVVIRWSLKFFSEGY